MLLGWTTIIAVVRPAFNLIAVALYPCGTSGQLSARIARHQIKWVGIWQEGGSAESQISS